MNKNYALMGTEKLRALLEVVEGDEKEAIEEILRKRENPPMTASNGRQVAIRMTNSEREALAEKLRKETVNHKCKVVPFNSIEWTEGVVVAIIEERRTNKVLYAVRLDDGRRVVKSYDSKLIEILPETVEVLAKTPRRAVSSEPWTKEDVEKAIQEVLPNVGKVVQYAETGAYGLLTGSGKMLTGRIIGIAPVKRTRSLLYRIEVDMPGGRKKIAHKMTTGAIKIADGELDEFGEVLNRRFIESRYGGSEEKRKEAMTAKQLFDYTAEQFAKAKTAFEKAQKLLERREEAYLEAKKAYEETMEQQRSE